VCKLVQQTVSSFFCVSLSHDSAFKSLTVDQNSALLIFTGHANILVAALTHTLNMCHARRAQRHSSEHWANLQVVALAANR
jgi:hypothetical protein